MSKRAAVITQDTILRTLNAVRKAGIEIATSHTRSCADIAATISKRGFSLKELESAAATISRLWPGERP